MERATPQRTASRKYLPATRAWLAIGWLLLHSGCATPTADSSSQGSAAPDGGNDSSLHSSGMNRDLVQLLGGLVH